MSTPLIQFERFALVALLAPSLAVAVSAPELKISGIEADLLKNVQQELSLAREPCKAPRWKINRLLNKADEEIGRALRALGHYHPAIEKQLAFGPACWSAQFSIQPGPVVNIRKRSVEIRGELTADPAYQELLQTLPLTPGSPLHHGQYETLKRQLQSLASERGYFDAELRKNQLRVNPEKGYADILLELESGPRYQIGELRFSEQPYQRSVLEPLIAAKPGTPYHTEQLQQTRRQLLNSGFFDQVQIYPLAPDPSNKQVPIAVELTARKRHRYQLSFGLTTDTGPRMAAGYENRRVNRRGHQFSTELGLSSVVAEVGVGYRIPLHEAPWREFTLQANYRDEEIDDIASRRWESILKLQRTRRSWIETLSLNLQREQSLTPDRTLDSTLLFPGITWHQSRADDLLRPSQGRRVQLSLRGAQEGLLSDSSFFQAQASGLWIDALSHGSLIGRIDLGTTLTDQFDQLPYSLRFFAGGDKSVRGYGYRELGPKGVDGTPLGARHLVAMSIEYEHRITQEWGAALFVDSGNAFDGSDDGLKTGVGVGARWYSPVGPVRLDLAFPLDQQDDQYRIHFSFGTRL